MEPFIQTVTGPIPASSLGFILPHEHTGLDSMGHEPEHSPHDHPWEWWDVFNDEDVIAEELLAYKGLGGSCLVDLTNIGLGRDPERLRRLSERASLSLTVVGGRIISIDVLADPDRLRRLDLDPVAD